MRIAGSSDLSKFDEPIILDTPQTYEEGIALLAKTTRAIAGKDVVAMTAGIPGLLSRDRRTLIHETNIPQWRGHAIADDIESALGTRVYLDNDVSFIGLGEAVYGAGKGAEIVVYITISTGVNSVRIVEGKVDPLAFGTSTGYQYVSMSDDLVDWQDLISGAAISKRFGMHPKALGKDNPIWEELARTTAFGVYNSIVHWSPDRVVIGGSMMNEIGIAIDRIRFHLEKVNKALPELPEIVHSSLGEVGGLWGGIARLRQLV